MKKRIGIFGGTFDPVHNGHVQIARSFLNSGLIRELLILLTPSPPHKEGAEQTNYSHRFNMLKLAFKEVEGAHVSDLEQKLPKPSFTFQTVRHLQQRYPDHLFYLCIGEDSLRDFHTWYKYSELIKKLYLIVAKRPGIDTSGVDPQILEQTIFIRHEPVMASSTSIRESNGDRQDDLPHTVTDYIKKNNLYR